MYLISRPGAFQAIWRNMFHLRIWLDSMLLALVPERSVSAELCPNGVSHLHSEPRSWPVSAALGSVSLRDLLICSLAPDKLLTTGCLLTASRTDFAFLRSLINCHKIRPQNKVVPSRLDGSLNRRERRIKRVPNLLTLRLSPALKL